MVTLVLYFALMFASILFMVDTYCEYRFTRDSAYACFCAIAALLIVFMTGGFVYFQPWVVN